MARPICAATRRDRIKKSLESALMAKNLSDDYYADRLEQYMEFYDTKTHINKRVKTMLGLKEPADRPIIDLTAEARRVDKQMMDILRFLGLKPPDEMPPADGDEDEL